MVRSSSRSRKKKVVTSTVPTPAKIGQYTLSQVDRSLLKLALVEYKYVSPPKSICEQIFLVKFWNAVAEHYPAWMAPNTVTFFGYICSLIAVAMTLYFEPHGFPSWYWLVVAFLLFLYQTADGSDGPQARRLQCGSALGELFDHGVDALVTSFICLISFTVTNVNLSHPIVPLGFACTMSAFFFSNATLLHTSRQLFNSIDAQETQLVCQALLVVVYCCGRDLFLYPLPLPSWVASTLTTHFSFVASNFMTLTSNLDQEQQQSWSIETRDALNMIVVCATTFNCIGACRNICAHYALEKGASVRATGRTLTEFWQQVRSMVLFFILIAVSWCTAKTATTIHATSSVYAFRLWFLSISFAFADHVNHVLVLRVAKIPFPSLIRTRCFWLIGFFALWTELGNRETDMTSPLIVYGDLGRCAVFALCFGSHFYYSYTVGGAIAQGLGVTFFSVPMKKQTAFLRKKKMESGGAILSTKKKKAATPVKKAGKYNRTTTLVENLRHPEKDDDVSLVLRPRHRTTRSSTRSKRS